MAESNLRNTKAAIKVQSWFRGCRARRTFQSLVTYYQASPEAKKFIHRNDVLREILATERHYLGCLKVIVEVFVQPLQANQKIISAESTKKIFSNIEEITKFHEMFYSKMETCAKEWPVWTTIGKVFVELAPFLKLYSAFVTNFDLSLKTLQRKKEKKSFREWKEVVEKNKRCCSLNLEGFLIMPIQRIPRYEMLLKELLKLTLDEHIDKPNIEKAFSIVKDTCIQINELKKKSEVNDAIVRQEQISNGMKKSMFRLFDSRSMSKRSSMSLN